MIPEITVIIPVWNRRAFLRDSVLSALQAASIPTEIIVVDDGSTDGSLKTVEDLPVVPVRLSNNLGMSVARNAGLAQAKGKYITFLDSDDLLLREGHQKRFHHLEHHPEDSVVGATSTFGPQCLPRKLSFSHLTEEIFLQKGPLPIAAWSLMYRREFIRDLGPFDENLYTIPDTEFIHRTLRQTEIEFLPSPCVHYRFHPNQTSLRKGAKEIHRRTLAEMALYDLSIRKRPCR